MEYDSPFSDTINSLWQNVLSTLRGIGARVLVHVVSVIAVTALFSNPFAYEGEVALTAGLLSFISYVGLICLVPRGMSLTGHWLIPTGMGLVSGAVLMVFGLPWELAIFWMGAQTWLIRLVRNRGKMGWEWAALPWLAIGAATFFSKTGPTLFRLLPVLVVPVMTVGGLALNLLYNRLYIGPIHRNRLKAAAAGLHRLLAREALIPALEPSCRQLAQQCDLLLRHGSFSTRGVVALVMQAEDAVAELGRMKPSGRGSATYGQVLAVQRTLEALAREMERQVRASGALERQDKRKTQEQGGDEGQFAAFHASAVDLLHKQFHLPPRLRGHIVQIAGSTENILECMRTDAADRANGSKFLAHYLPAAHKIVDQYLRLSREGKDFDEVTKVLARSEDLLARLESAFKDEHKQLLHNDAVNLTAELNVLDTLLKMEGR